jgi:two-component system, response regulator / RNA-binding antiterminator
MPDEAPPSRAPAAYRVAADLAAGKMTRAGAGAAAGLLDNGVNWTNASNNASVSRPSAPRATARCANPPPARGVGMRVWLLLGPGGEDPNGLESMLRPEARPDDAACHTEVRPLTAAAAAEARLAPPEVVVVADAALPSAATAEEWLALGAALVVAVEEGRAGPYLALAEDHPVVPVPARPTAEALGLAVRAAAAARRRQLHWQGEAERLRRRLEDRILIERAKGVLVRLWGVGEEEAYRRLHAYARQHRKPIREVAQSLLESHALLAPENGAAPGADEGLAP